ncbi:MAG: tetratricopeptide repeat protein [Polyangiaceae bacterium]
MTRITVLGVGVLSLLATSCGPGGAAQAVRPKDQKAADALGESKVDCRDVSRGAEPLVVDWKPEQRADLEVAMKDGIAVVKYDCHGLDVLSECKLAGEYGYIAMTKREQVVRLSDADEVKANLPLSGGSLGGELQRGSSLDVGIVMVGKHRTTWKQPTKADLQGECAGATHIVRAATVGAFVLSTGTNAKVAAAAELFGAGASTKSESSRQTKNQDGDPNSCGGAKPDDSSPPAQCGAAIRLVLSPIAPEPKGDATPAAAPAAETQCPEGLVLTEGKCGKPTETAAYQCKASDEAECKAQCDKGHAGSCGSLGHLLLDKDGKAAMALFDKACKDGDGPACAAQAREAYRGKAVSADPAVAKEAGGRACDLGIAEGCTVLGLLAKKDDAAAAQAAFGKACEGGDALGCAEAATLLSATDATKALRLHERACHGGIAESCIPIANAYDAGAPGVGKNPVLASILYRRACYSGSGLGCFHLGRLEFAQDKDSAKREFNMACMRNEKLGCAALNVGFGDQRVAVFEPAKKMAATQACMRGSNLDCVLVGLMDGAMKMPTAGQHFKQACMRGDQTACAFEKSLAKP